MLSQSIHQVLSAYPLGYSPLHWKSLGTFAGFSRAVIVRVETALGPCCLRGWPVRSLPHERILGLHRMLAFAFDAGLESLAVPVPARTGETLVNFEGRCWQLEPWRPGSADYWSQPSRSRLKNAVIVLARFHQITQNYADPGPAREWFFHQEAAASPTIAERLSCLRDWQQMRLARLKLALPSASPPELLDLGQEFISRFESLSALIGTELEILSRVPFPLQVCLRDVWHDHILFTGENITGLIDASAARSENIATDLARLLGSFLMDDREAWEFALREYETFRPLDANEKALVQALDHSGVLLSAMAWLDRLILNEERVPHWPKVLDRMQFLARRLRSLDESISRTLWH